MIDASGGAVVPGFVDPHTHVVFAGDRRDELRRRLAGATYAEIAAEGGGILGDRRRDPRGDRRRSSSPRRAAASTRCSRCGTTTCEAKSGYGADDRVRAARCCGRSARWRRARRSTSSPTFMGAHEIPPEYRDRRDAYVELVIDEMIPAVAREGLAEWCDVFCEQGVFTPDESRAILEAGRGARPEAAHPRRRARRRAAARRSPPTSARGRRTT